MEPDFLLFAYFEQRYCNSKYVRKVVWYEMNIMCYFWRITMRTLKHSTQICHKFKGKFFTECMNCIFVGDSEETFIHVCHNFFLAKEMQQEDIFLFSLCSQSVYLALSMWSRTKQVTSRNYNISPFIIELKHWLRQAWNLKSGPTHSNKVLETDTRQLANWCLLQFTLVSTNSDLLDRLVSTVSHFLCKLNYYKTLGSKHEYDSLAKLG